MSAESWIPCLCWPLIRQMISAICFTRMYPSLAEYRLVAIVRDKFVVWLFFICRNRCLYAVLILTYSTGRRFYRVHVLNGNENVFHFISGRGPGRSTEARSRWRWGRNRETILETVGFNCSPLVLTCLPLIYSAKNIWVEFDHQGGIMSLIQSSYY